MLDSSTVYLFLFYFSLIISFIIKNRSHIASKGVIDCDEPESLIDASRTGNYNPVLYIAIPDSREDIAKMIPSSLYAGISQQAVG